MFSQMIDRDHLLVAKRALMLVEQLVVNCTEAKAWRMKALQGSDTSSMHKISTGLVLELRWKLLIEQRIYKNKYDIDPPIYEHYFLCYRII